MSRAHLSIAYDGAALRGGVMDVRDLAPALLAVGQLFDAANKALNGDETSVKVQVRATTVGSFSIDLELVMSMLAKAKHFLIGEDVTAAANLLTIVSGATGSLLWLAKVLHGGSPRSISKQDSDTARIVLTDDTTLDVPLSALRLYSDLSVRSALEQMIAEPLAKDGIDTFEVRADAGIASATVTKDEARYFIQPAMPEEQILETVRRAAYSIISLAFKEDNKWRLSDGANQISARIEDQIFLARVETNQIAFAKGDILICDVRITATQGTAGLRTEYIVERVVEHRPALRQLKLPFDDLAT